MNAQFVVRGGRRIIDLSDGSRGTSRKWTQPQDADESERDESTSAELDSDPQGTLGDFL